MVLLPLYWEFMRDGDYYEYTSVMAPEPSRIKKKQTNNIISLKYFIMILIWKFNNRKWTKCRQKTKALNKYKNELLKGCRK